MINLLRRAAWKILGLEDVDFATLRHWRQSVLSYYSGKKEKKKGKESEAAWTVEVPQIQVRFDNLAGKYHSQQFMPVGQHKGVC